MKYIFFDLDGTIADTEYLKAKALSVSTEFYCQKKIPLEIYKEVMGQNWTSVTQKFFEFANINLDLKEFNQVFKNNFKMSCWF